MRADVKDAMRRVHYATAMRGDARHLEAWLEAGEEVREVTGAELEGHLGTGVLALTDRRLLFGFHGLVREAHADLPLTDITSVQVIRGLASAKLSFEGPHPLSFDNVDKVDADRFANATRRAVATLVGSNTTAPGGASHRDGAWSVYLPYSRSIGMPRRCTGCGAAAALLDRKVSKTYHGVSVATPRAGLTKRTFTIGFPMCADCAAAQRSVSNREGLAALLALVIAAGVLAATVVVSANWWIGVVASVVTFAVAAVVLVHRVDRRVDPEVLARSKALDASARIEEVREDDHLTLAFSRRDIAEQVAAMNGGSVA